MAQHPLEPLTVEEIRTAAAVCKRYATAQGLPPLRFNVVTLQVGTRSPLLLVGLKRLAAPL